MNEALQELYEHFFEMGEEKRIERVKEAVSKIRNFMSNNELNIYFEPQFIERFPVDVFGAFIAADQMVNVKELDLFNAVFDKDYSLEDLAKLAKRGLDQFVIADIDSTTDKLPFEIKNEVCVIGLSAIVNDAELNEQENRLFELILA